MEILIETLEDKINIPKYQTQGSAGVDLESNEEYILKPQEVRGIATGLKIEIPNGFEAQVRSRSGLSLKNIVVANSPGTIDSDFRGEIKVILKNTGDQDFHITKGLRIAQMVFAKVEQVNFKIVKNLSSTERGSGGFGSTGL